MPVSADSGAPTRGFGLYVHWPFCVSKCPYCDFNSHVRASVDEALFARALVTELQYMAAAGYGAGQRLSSIFFGGGTPSLMTPETVASLLSVANSIYGFTADIEVTLEANPNSAEAAKFAGFAAAGVNRISIGVQSFDPATLKFLGRAHDVDEAEAAIRAARKSVPRYSFDLIYARPGQSQTAWREELLRALHLAGDHLSLYTLTIEPNTGFAGAVARRVFAPMPEEEQAALYDLTAGLLQEAGMPAYEISNYARPGGESRHNLVYWRSGEYLGIGPGAHARLRHAGEWQARYTLKKPEAWLEQVRAQGHGTADFQPVSRRMRAEEALMMGLRLEEGIFEGNLEAVSGMSLDDLVPAARSAPLEQAGLLERSPGRLRATMAGRAVLDAVLGRLLT